MSFNGSGVYTLPGPQLASGETVSATENNQFRNDVAQAFNVTFCRDGEALPTANWDMNGFKLTGLPAGTTNGDSVRYEQVTSDVDITGGTISGVTISGSAVDLTGSTITDVTITDSSGSFNSLSATSVSGTGFDDYLKTPPPIGGTTPNNGTFVITKAIAYQETKATISASDIDLLVANYFTKTLTGNITFTVSNVPTTGNVASFILDLTDAGTHIITWWSGIEWAAGGAPVLTEVGRDILGFFTYDGGITWAGFLLARDAK